ncbi:alpha-1,2-fucosyltransferase [Helicobacter sp.]|uniref:alpha-1,2-fucosyltransferase n=1 Tax=Helicobacter sp. TaxID=218 RepID=UPI0025BF5008|nr:alpha-1,2-fucosyltransferase [Helicobacter sp.]MBR2494183.1 alpha-1,2-fucosyltransferase [Helicobacter sp.]
MRDLELTKFCITLPVLHHFPNHFPHSWHALDQDSSQAGISTQAYYQALCTKALRKLLPPNGNPARFLRRLYTTSDSPKLVQRFHAHYPFSRNARFEGVFSNAVYFAEIESILRQEFTLKAPKPSAKALQEYIQSTSNSVFLHIRRGDYLAQENWEYVKLGSAYYDAAIALMRTKVSNPIFFIFSDDLQWCKNELYTRLQSLKGTKLHFIGNNDQSDAISDLVAMAACQNAIIANSTFSFWGAYLINNPAKLIIRPAQYTWRGYSPLCYPESWCKLDVIWGEITH